MASLSEISLDTHKAQKLIQPGSRTPEGQLVDRATWVDYPVGDLTVLNEIAQRIEKQKAAKFQPTMRVVAIE